MKISPQSHLYSFAEAFFEALLEALVRTDQFRANLEQLSTTIFHPGTSHSSEGAFRPYPQPNRFLRSSELRDFPWYRFQARTKAPNAKDVVSTSLQEVPPRSLNLPRQVIRPHDSARKRFVLLVRLHRNPRLRPRHRRFRRTHARAILQDLQLLLLRPPAQHVRL